MANQEHLEILRQGVNTWNEWRMQKQLEAKKRRMDQDKKSGLDLIIGMVELFGDMVGDASGLNLNRVDLEGADLNGAMLQQVNFKAAYLPEVNLSSAFLVDADFSFATLLASKLSNASLMRADFSRADLSNADLRGANLTGARLWETNLTDADLRGADLSGASLIEANIDGSKISGCSVYGVNVWNLKGEFAEQNDLNIDSDDSKITVDNIKTAQFLYLILNNEEIRGVINTLTSKSVLILGRFAIPERKNILDALRSKLREYDLLPIVFDFDRPADRDYTETVQTLAGLSLFVIVDVTNPKSTPLEMEATVKQFKIPYVPIIDLSADPRPFAMMMDSQNSFHWVLQTFGYYTKQELLENIDAAIISRALEKYNELKVQKASEQKILTINDLRKTNQ